MSTGVAAKFYAVYLVSYFNHTCVVWSHLLSVKSLFLTAHLFFHKCQKISVKAYRSRFECWFRMDDPKQSSRTLIVNVSLTDLKLFHSEMSRQLSQQPKKIICTNKTNSFSRCLATPFLDLETNRSHRILKTCHSMMKIQRKLLKNCTETKKVKTQMKTGPSNPNPDPNTYLPLG